ncbi:hypothetical protein RFN28_19210 [Mesorhizobium sp. VK24D]|uniref:Uncharacterized protein n=1 Tax=Mesorhizobium album TaxID=3072314 RepID=A0ABU4Y399_9HYPH|nr:hypothetical protein [Mesorhizobium sp. VK24D]MDX8480575.1 hypothetical protein [Mesorhizobium sp. VK24D]
MHDLYKIDWLAIGENAPSLWWPSGVDRHSQRDQIEAVVGGNLGRYFRAGYLARLFAILLRHCATGLTPDFLRQRVSVKMDAAP